MRLHAHAEAMRARRRSSFAVAFGDLAFAIAAFGCGLYDAPLWLAGLAAFGMLAYWSWTRRMTLNRLRGAAWASQTSLAMAVLITILAGAYWLGLGLGGSL
jgi:hypothetical protein